MLLLTFLAFLVFFAFLAFFATLTLEFCYRQTGYPGIFWTVLNEADVCWLPPLLIAGKRSFCPKIDPTFPKLQNRNPNFSGIPKKEKAF